MASSSRASPAAVGGEVTAALPPDSLRREPELYRIVVEHAYRGLRIHLVMRGVLVAFMILVVVFVPPKNDRDWCAAIAAIAAIWWVASAWLIRRGGEQLVRLVWLTLFVDLALLTAMTAVAGNSAKESWTADVLVTGFFIVPVLAATQLRPWVCAAVVAPTVGFYLGVSIATKGANGEPWSSVLVRTSVLAGVALGAVLLSWVQRSRVLTIGRLVVDRSHLLTELVTIEAREQRRLAEALHDGALQYVLAARQDVEDAREHADPASFERVDEALLQSSRLLRSAVSELHPAVLDQSGLPAAVEDLARSAAARGNFEVTVDADGWSKEVRTSADGLLFATARELLNNVVKHAGARRVSIVLRLDGKHARLEVGDDGRGIESGQLERRLGEGHIGLASRRARVEAAGGQLSFDTALPAGTIATVEVPAAPL